MGAALKKMGMLPGYPDLDIIDGTRTIHVEFKTPKGRQSPQQKHVQEMLVRMGREYIICRSYEQFIEICHEHFGPERDPDLERLREILLEKK